jgi:hypothetical protein
MVAGPIMTGIASGTTAMSSRSSSGRPVAWLRVPLVTRLIAVRNSRLPAPIRKEFRVMPIALNNSGPAKNRTNPRIKADTVERRITDVFSAADWPRVSARNMVTTKKGASKNRKRIVLLR